MLKSPKTMIKKRYVAMHKTLKLNILSACVQEQVSNRQAKVGTGWDVINKSRTKSRLLSKSPKTLNTKLCLRRGNLTSFQFVHKNRREADKQE